MNASLIGSGPSVPPRRWPPLQKPRHRATRTNIFVSPIFRIGFQREHAPGQAHTFFSFFPLLSLEAAPVFFLQSSVSYRWALHGPVTNHDFNSLSLFQNFNETETVSFPWKVDSTGKRFPFSFISISSMNQGDSYLLTNTTSILFHVP